MDLIIVNLSPIGIKDNESWFGADRFLKSLISYHFWVYNGCKKFGSLLFLGCL